MVDNCDSAHGMEGLVGHAIRPKYSQCIMHLQHSPRTWSTCDEIDMSLETTTPRILSWSTRSIPIRGGLGDCHLPPLVTSSSLELVALSCRLCGTVTSRFSNINRFKMT